MTMHRHYDSWREPFDIAIQILQSLTHQQWDDLIARLPPDLSDEFRKICTDPSSIKPHKLVTPVFAGIFKIIGLMPEIAFDEVKNDAIEVTEAIFRIQALTHDNQTLSDEDELAVTYLNSRFKKEKPFIPKATHVSWEYDQARVPTFLTKEFTAKVVETILDTLAKDPNADLTPYEKELGITVTKVEHPDRSIAQPVPVSPPRKKVVL
jgi:hypothetical protein